MLGTYASALLVLVAAAAVGQAVFALCGRRRWSWLAPAVGLAALMPISWWAVRLPGEGTAGIIALGMVTIAAAGYLAGRVEGLGDAVRSGMPVVVLALAAASLPFIAEGRFGILGTGLNPDMSQHLFAADRLASSGTERLIEAGYPLGPHSLAVSLSALGPSLVQSFGGLTIAAAAIGALAPIGVLGGIVAWRRIAVALLVGLAYMTAAYLTQGAFKETIQALFVLAFAIALAGIAAGRLAGPGKRRVIPLAVLAAGSVYAYSFPGLLWLGGALGAWGALELALLVRRRSLTAARRKLRRALPSLGLGVGILVVLIAPELGRMADFANFETFDPGGSGLGNLFNRISPFEALGVWPSGDFRVEAGDGAAPAILFWLGAALALAALVFGVWWWWRQGIRALPAALAAALALVAVSAVAGTPYQEAKAIALASPLVMLISAGALARAAPGRRRVVRIVRRRGIAKLFPRSARTARLALGVSALAATFGIAAGVSSLLALANGPVGPERWGPAVLEVAPLEGSTLVLAPQSYLAGEHGRDLIVWELRGGRVCVESEGAPSLDPPPPGISQVLVYGASASPPYDRLGPPERVGQYTLWPVSDPTPGESGCAFIADGDRADPAAGG